MTETMQQYKTEAIGLIVALTMIAAVCFAIVWRANKDRINTVTKQPMQIEKNVNKPE